MLTAPKQSNIKGRNYSKDNNIKILRIAVFDIFTLLYKEAKELISKWFYRFPKGKTQKCSSSHQFMLQRKGIYGRNESEWKAKNGAKKQRYCRKRALTYVAYFYTFIHR